MLWFLLCLASGFSLLLVSRAARLWHSAPVSTPSRWLPEAKAQTPLAALQMLAKVPGSFSELRIVFQMYPGDVELSRSGQSPSFGPCSPGTTGWVWQAGSSGQGCLLLVRTWGGSGGFRALGWLLAGVETAGTVRVFTPHPGSSQTLISEHLCGPGPVLGAVRAQRQEVLTPAFQELPSHRLK